MPDKLENALGTLNQSVERLEAAYKESEKNEKSHTTQQHQNDLFGAVLNTNPQANNSQSNGIDRGAMAAVLDRTISRVEKLVGEGR